MCNYISQSIESKLDHNVIINLIEFYLNNYKEAINSTLLDKFQKKLVVILSNKKRNSNYNFRNIRSLSKWTKRSNEVRHKNYKYKSDIIEPEFSIKNL